MRSISRMLAVAFLAAIVIARPASAASPQDVDAMIDKAKQFLYSKTRGGNWEPAPARSDKAKPSDLRGGQWGTLTALSTYALLAAGESPQEPRLAKSIEFLRTADITGIYALGMRAQVWFVIPKTDAVREAIAKDTKLLLLARKNGGPNSGLYEAVNTGPTGGGIDHSFSHYGVLGMWACNDIVEVPEAYWIQVDQGWRRDQGPDGSWAVSQKPGESATDAKTGAKSIVAGTPAMTAAGVSALFISQDFLNRGKGLDCSGNIADKNIDSGLKWLADHFDGVFTGSGAFNTLYRIERVGAASGFKYFGAIDWYQQGADWLVKQQKPDGSFPGKGADATLENTCFALLFLSHGRAPVVMNKLQYSIAGKEGDWNERPRDVSNIAKWIGQQTENELNWQSISINAPVNEWHDAPIIYISGDQPLDFTADEKAKLKRFAEQGGMIVGNADCGKKEFVDSFKKLGSELFSNYEFAALPPTHPIFHDEQYLSSKWKKSVTLLGMDNGVREMMLLLPDADPAKAWQMQEAGGREELFQLAANVFLYAIDKTGLSNKGETHIVEPDARVKPTATISVSRLKFAGNWDPEPAGWPRLSGVMHNGDSIDVSTVELDPAAAALAGKGIAHLTGTGAIKLAQPARDAIKTFVTTGGTLVVDAAGGNTQFAQAVEEELKKIFGADADQLKQPLALDSPLYSAGGALTGCTYRTFARAALGNVKEPRIRGITLSGRLAVIYSAEDLSAGLVGEPVDGIVGYDPDTATALMRKVLLLASGAKPVTPPGITPPKPTTKPARKPRTPRVPKPPKATTQKAVIAG